MIDVGTGDGLFVYESARENPERFFVGIDANRRALEKISEKIHRRPALPNALYLQAGVEDLPEELDGVADEVWIQFPWGSLLRAVLLPDPAVLAGLRRICAPGAVLRVFAAIDPVRDRAELERLGLPSPSLSSLAPPYEKAGFEVIELRELARAEWASLRTSWAKRLRSAGTSRRGIVLTARCRPAPSSD